MKKKYIIHVDTEHPENMDPNLERIAADCRKKAGNPFYKNFEFECELVFDGYQVIREFSDMLTALMHDMADGSNLFHSIWKQEDLPKRLWEFIIGTMAASGGRQPGMSGEHLMEAFIGHTFYFRCTVPEEMVPERKYKEFLAMGPDFLMGTFTPEEIFRYMVPDCYFTLANEGRLGEAKLRRLQDYMIGLA